MGQQLFKVDLNIGNDTTITSETILSSGGKDDISFFFPLNTSSDPTEANNDHQIPNSQIECIKQIRDYLSILTKSIQWENINTEINEILMDIIFPSIIKQNEKVIEEINTRMAYKQQLQTALINKLKEDNYCNVSIFSQSFIDSTSENGIIAENQQQQKDKQLSFFAIQSLLSILLILIKSAEKNDPTIIHQILILTGQLCEQLPIKCLSSKNSFLFKSLEPLTSYIHDLSLTSDSILSKQAIKILLSFSIAKGSFKDMLSLLNKLIFNTTDVYHVQGLIIQLNNGLTETINEWEKQKEQLVNDNESNEGDNATSKELTEIASLNYLKSINSFPNTKLQNLTEDCFTGQFISSIILSHIDIENELNSPIKQSKLSSISCEFHSNTFKDLFNIIKQLTSPQSNTTISHMLTISLRLFTTHLQILSDRHNDVSIYTSDIELKTWFDLLLKLACNENSEQINLSKEASKALMNVINIQISSFDEKLSLIHKYIIENKHPMLIKQFSIELNKNETLLNWIEILCDENHKSTALDILYSFIDLYFNENEEPKSQFLLTFQQLLLYRLIDSCEKRNLTTQLPLLITEYLSYIFKKCLHQNFISNDLFNSILNGLCLMTKTDEIFLYDAIQPIFIAILPLLAEYYLKHLDNEFLCCLIGKICHVLIIGSPEDSLEIKHINKLKLPIFAGGCITNKNDYLVNSNLAVYSRFQLTNDNQEEKDFLMSVYNNTDDGARLISKLKMFIKDKQRLLQKSIEQQANDACAAVFSVYIKHYRRINLAKSELLRTDQNKPHTQLLSIYEYANRIQTLFATIKGQGGDCNELYKQIKIKALFLLLSVKESDLIAIVKEDIPALIIDITPKKEFKFQRQHSRWSKARHVLKILQNLFQACIRFKRFLLEKKQTIEQKYDYESLLNRTIDSFIYGDFYKTSASITIEEKQLEIDELEKCLYRQHERAMIRLMTYRFIRTFIQNVLNLANNDQCLPILSLCLPYMRRMDLEWSYFDNIPASNNQLREEISNTYYSILKLVLSFTLQSNNFTQTTFYLLNLSYESIDICHMYHHQFIETLFTSFVSLVKNPEHNTTLGLKLTAFNWFRLFVLKLCENIEIEQLRDTSNPVLQQQENFVFNTLILNELKGLQQMEEVSPIDTEEQKNNSLKDVAINWFLRADESKIELYTNQYLVLLLRCMHFYKHVLSVCATVDFLKQFLGIYHHNQSNITRLLIIKILRHLIPVISDNPDGISKDLIEKFLADSLTSIGENIISQEIIAEFIYMYRTIMSINSSWQTLAIKIVFDSIKSYLNFESIETNDTNQMNKLLASLNIMGGYIEPYRLGSIVTSETDEKLTDEPSLALIIEINNTEKPYLLQYLQTNQTESVSIDKLRLKIDVPPPNLPTEIDSILDILGYFIQIDTSTNNSLMLLQLKRRSMAVLYHLLNEKSLIEIFMDKPYASIIAKLCISNSKDKTHQQPADLRLFNKQHLQQYCLSLDTCERLKHIIEDENKEIVQELISTNEQNDSSYTIWNNVDKTKRDQLIIDALSTYNRWKPYVTEGEMEFLKQGRIGSDEICIVPMPRNTADIQVIEECGVKHRFRGRIAPNYDNTAVSFPSFIIDNLQLNEGKWYYCVRLPVGGVIQIGWATNGFTPASGAGVGDDKYSWSYDGSRGVLFNDEGFYGQFDDIRWNENDVCGCGIEIDGKNTKIKYWLNGKFLGTAFEHNSFIPESTTKCNLLPNGSNTSYYPAVTLQWSGDPPRCCELILSPEDMQDCPLPNGYKPLLLPKSVHTENSIVDYPFSAYLIGDDEQDFFLTTRTKPTTRVLRDFINDHHLETTFNVDNHHLSLPANSNGFQLPIDNNEATSLTISFDFQILSTEEKADILLFTLDSTEITWERTDEKLQCVIIFLSKKRQIKVCINNKCRIFSDVFQYETIKKLNIHILPGIASEIKNLAIWKYALSEEHIDRLFTYGLFYVVAVYQQLKDYRKQVNRISFSKNQQEFSNELLIPLNKPFTEELWEKNKTQVDNDEWKYFKTHNDMDYSTVELFGNKTYLVLNKSNEEWSKYTLVLDLCIPRWPVIHEKLTLIILNPKCELYITHNGKICLESDGASNESHSPVIPNEYFRLFLTVQGESLQIYLNNKLEIDIKITDDRFQINSNRIELFKETDFTRNTTNEDTLRVSFKSITYLNRSISIDQLQSPTLTAPTFTIIGLSLMAMGYKKSWIQSVIEQNKATDMSTIHTILREQKPQFIKQDLENERKRYLNIFSKLDPSIDSEVFKNLIGSSKFDTNQHTTDIAERIFKYWISLQASDERTDEFQGNFDANWFSQSVQDLGIQGNITEWIRDKASVTKDEDNVYELFDLNQSEHKQKRARQSMQYSHENISSKQFLESRIACEHGLTTIYARYTILNMLKVWSYDRSSLFLLEKFGDYTFLITLLKLLDDTEMNKNEKIVRMHLLINSILKTEMKQLLEHIDRNQLQSKAPLFYHLQKDLIIQSIEFLFKQNSDEQQPNIDFILKTLNLFRELITDKSSFQQHQIDSIIPFLFPIPLINLIFNLFLLVPTHQSKISILYLFTTLIQTSEYIKLNNQIQQFFYQLLIELSSVRNSSKKKLQIALTDLIFVLLSKQKKQATIEHNNLKEFQSKLPKDIQNLLTTIDVIITWTDQTQLPEVFLTQSTDILGDSFKLNQDDFQKSKHHFNTMADQDLINFMNNNSLLDDSFSTFILSLPIESEPNLEFYKNYALLSNIPADCIQIRARLIYLLNKFIEPNLSTVDFSLPQGQSILTDQIRTIKLYLLSSTKFQLFSESLEKTEGAYTSEWQVVNFDTVKASTDTDKSENTMFYQAYQQLHANAHIIFRRSNEQIWHAQYIGMHSTDSGGPYRDSITRICLDICSTRLSLFILCPNGRTNNGLNRDCWIPNVFPPNKRIPKKFQKQYRFVGQLMGMAIRKKHYLDMKFPILLWKQLLREQITIEDIEAIDIQSFTIINEMEKNMEQIRSMDADNDIESLFSSIMSELRFDVVSSSGQAYELVPGGTEIPITAANFKHYCSCYRQYRLNEFNRQINLIREGLYSVVPCYYLSLFTAKELEEAVCGKDRIDIELLKRNTYYGGEYNADSPPMERFWTVLNEMFNDEQKKSFLIFVWGRSTLPSRDEDFQSKFILNKFDVYDGEVDKTLPRSHTCFFTIDLPEYSTTEIMYERLNYAMSSCSSIDGDGMMNDAPNVEDFNLEETSDD